LKKLSDNNFNFLLSSKKFERKGLRFLCPSKTCAGTVGNTILTAPTGSGKTESRPAWDKTSVETNGQARVFYILPFTASIHAMYERLKKAMGDEALDVTWKA
jgi:CRISPR-associated endonuclease/helicase Cas3